MSNESRYRDPAPPYLARLAGDEVPEYSMTPPPERSTLPLGPGELDFPEEHDRKQVGFARWYYLEAVARIYPRVFMPLLTDVYPLFATNPEGGEDLDRALATWQEESGLADHWIRDVLVANLRHWDPVEGLDGFLEHWPRMLVTRGSSARERPPARTLVKPDFFTFSYMPWGFDNDTRANYEYHVKRNFEWHLKMYLDDIERRALAHGMVRTPEKHPGKPRKDASGRRRQKGDADQHFLWLVRWRVPDPATGKRWTQKRIGNEYGRDTDTIKDGLRVTAALLE